MKRAAIAQIRRQRRPVSICMLLVVLLLMIDAHTVFAAERSDALYRLFQVDLPPAGADEMLDDNKRAAAMLKFVDADDRVGVVRKKLNELFTQQGRINMRQQLERYSREVLLPAINELDEDDKVRDQLVVALARLQEIITELEPASGGLKLSR